MSEQNCLTCKYEPKWGEFTGGTYSRCVGSCKLLPVFPVLPGVVDIRTHKIVRYSDDSGIHTECAAWEGKSNPQPTTQQGEE